MSNVFQPIAYLVFFFSNVAFKKSSNHSHNLHESKNPDGILFLFILCFLVCQDKPPKIKEISATQPVVDSAWQTPLPLLNTATKSVQNTGKPKH